MQKVKNKALKGPQISFGFTTIPYTFVLFKLFKDLAINVTYQPEDSFWCDISLANKNLIDKKSKVHKQIKVL